MSAESDRSNKNKIYFHNAIIAQCVMLLTKKKLSVRTFYAAELLDIQLK